MVRTNSDICVPPSRERTRMSESDHGAFSKRMDSSADLENAENNKKMEHGSTQYDRIML